MSQRKFKLSESSVKIFAAVGQDTAWNRSVSDSQQWVSGNQEIQHDRGNIGLVRRSDGENAEKNTPATGIADLCHLQNPEEGFDVLFCIFFPFSKFFTSLLYLQVVCQQPVSNMWDGPLPLSILQPLESSIPVPMAGQCGRQKTRFPSSSDEERNTEVSLWIATGLRFAIFGSPVALHWPFLDTCLT